MVNLLSVELKQKIKNRLDIEDQQNGEKGFIPEEKDPNVKTTFNSFNIPVTTRPNAQRRTLSKILTFVKHMQHLRFSDRPTVVPIAITSKFLISLFKSAENASRAVQFMKNIGLIATYDNTYQFHARNKKYNRCKKYEWSLDAEKQFLEYCKANGIEPFAIKNAKPHKKIDVPLDGSIVRIGTGQHLEKPKGVSTDKWESSLTLNLEENYKLLGHFFELSDSINAEFYEEKPLLRTKFIPTFTWDDHNKYVRKIGIRATNSVVSYKKEKEEGDVRMSRGEFLEQEGCTFEYDVKSSVPRVTDALNKGRWDNDNGHDFYYDIWVSYVKNRPEDPVPWCEETRDNFKYFFMRCYFDKDEENIIKHIIYDLSKKGLWKEEYKPEVKKDVRAFNKAIKDALGPSYGSEIFLHESCIYMMVLHTLLKRGLKVVQIYDGFYTSEEVPDMSEIIERCANKYLKMLGKFNKDDMCKVMEKHVNKYVSALKLYLSDAFPNVDVEDLLEDFELLKGYDKKYLAANYKDTEELYKIIEDCEEEYIKYLASDESKGKEEEWLREDLKYIEEPVSEYVNSFEYFESLSGHFEEDEREWVSRTMEKYANKYLNALKLYKSDSVTSKVPEELYKTIGECANELLE